MELDKDPFENLMPGGGQAVGTNPFMGVFKTSDGKFINLTVLSPGPYIEDVFGHLGIPEAAKDERFATAEAIMANAAEARSEEHTSELQSLMRISYAVFCLKTKKHTHKPLANHTALNTRTTTPS